jgi:hypothetical protein
MHLRLPCDNVINQEGPFVKHLQATALVAAFSLLGGCASITSGTSQMIAVETSKNDLPVMGANCRVTSDKGTWNIVTPATFEIPKSSGDARIVCEKAGEPKGEAVAKSSFKSNTVGNVLIGGVIGIGVDAMTGAMWAYPVRWMVKLGVPDQFLYNTDMFAGRDKPVVEGDTSKKADEPKPAEEPKK